MRRRLKDVSEKEAMEDEKRSVEVATTDAEVEEERSEGLKKVAEPTEVVEAVEEMDEDVDEDEEEMHPDTMRGQATMACQGWSMLYSSIRSALSGAVQGKTKEEEEEAEV